MTGAPSGPLKLAADFLADAPPVDDHDLQDLAHKWLVHRGLPIAARITPALHGLWTDGFLVGSISARTVLAHHLVKAESTVTMAADWAHWSPGDEVAARELLGAEGFGDGLQALLDAGNVVIKGIEATKLDQLAAILATGVQHGDAPATIGQAIRALVDDPKWAYKVALTETTRAVSSATLLRYSRNGVTGKEWMDAGDQHVCTTICGPNADLGAILLDQAFPSGDDAPPGHPLCRCSIGPAWLTAEEAAAAGAPMLPGFNPGDQPLANRAGPARAGGRAQATAVHIRPELEAARTASQVFKAFQAEAERITGRTGRDAIGGHFDGSAATAREHAEGLLRGLERFPDAKLNNISTLSDEAKASTYADANSRGTIRFSYRWTEAKARAEYLESTARGAVRQEYGVSEFSSFHPVGTGHPTGVAVHEFGHIVDIATLGERIEPDVLRLLAERVTVVPEGVPDYVAARWDQEMMIKHEISQYATHSTHELIAEAFGDVMMNGNAASALSRDIFDLLEAEYRKGGFTAGKDVVAEARAMPAPKAGDALAKQTVAQLRALAKDRGLTGYSKLTKPQLLERLRAAEPAVVERAGVASGREALTAGQLDLSGVRRIPGVSDAERKAVDLYMNDAQRINALIREGRTGSATIRNLDRLMQRSALQQDTELWRGLKTGRGVFGDRLSSDVTGFEWTEQAYLSTSANRTVAEEFGGAIATDQPAVVMRLVAPHGTGALTLSDWGTGRAIGGQAEVLLDRGYTLRVVADRGLIADPNVSAGIRLLDVEVIPKTAAKEVAERLPAAGEHMTEAQAVARQAVLDEVRGRADIAAEIHQLVANQASERALLARITGREKLTGIRVPDLKALVNDPGALLRAVDDMADRAGLARIGDMTGGPVPFDRKLMEGEKGLTSGQQVIVTKPGYTATLANGETIQVARAQVMAATQDEIRAAAERVAAEQKATERAIARAAARERNQILEARTKVGDLLAELDELVDKKAAANVFEERLSYAESTGAVDKATAAVLRKAVATEDPAKVRAALTRVASKNGLKPIGQAGKTAKYDPALHEPVGAVPADGTTVRVVRRGMSTTIDGQDVQLTRARTTVPEAKPKPAPKPKLEPRATAVTRAGTPATDYEARQAAVRDLSAQTPSETRQLGGGFSAYTNLLSYPDGSKLVEKIYSRVQETKAAAQRSVDAERFGAQVLDALGVRTPAVAQLGPGRLGMEWIDGQVGAELGFGDPFATWPAEILASDDAPLMGLADLLMANSDRNEGNWIRMADGHLAGIDHGSSFEHVRSTPGQAGFNPFASSFVQQKAGGAGRVWATNDMSPADMAVIRARLEALQPAFAEAKRLPWFSQMMSRFAEIEKRAVGTQNRIAEVVIDHPVVRAPISDSAERLDSILDRALAGDKGVKGDIAAGIDGRYGDYTVTTTSARVDDGSLLIRGVIRTADGSPAGKFIRTIGRDERGTYAYHNFLGVGRKYQGQGLGQALNDNLMAWYRRSGIQEIRLQANVDVGGYTWASAGWDFKDADAARGIASRLDAVTGDIQRGNLSPAVAKKVFRGASPAHMESMLADADKVLKRIRTSSFGDADYPSAYEISQIGRWAGAGKGDVWLGKFIMLESKWDGVLPVS